MYWLSVEAVRVVDRSCAYTAVCRPPVQPAVNKFMGVKLGVKQKLYCTNPDGGYCQSTESTIGFHEKVSTNVTQMTDSLKNNPYRLY